jgi:glycosyltransferase involved in cell wall biosynthesis
MMKLVIFINSLAGGGAERAAATLANHWARKQWDVTIVTLAPQSLDFYPLEPTVRRIALDLAGDSAHVLDALVLNGRRIRALRRTIRQLRPKVVLSLMSTSNVLLAFATLGMSGVYTVGAEHCYPPNFPLGRIWQALRSRMYGRLAAVVALTQECAAWIRAHSSARRVPVIPNAACWPLPVNLPRIVPDAVCSPQRKVLLAVGRLSPEKNFDMLVDVFARLASRHPDWDLVILGEGPERRMLELRIRDAALVTRVLMPGIAGNVGEWHARADLYVMTSRFEGFPNALAEALAHGLPAVSFDCDTGPRDIIRHGVDGLLVPPQDAPGLEHALDRLMEDTRLRAEMACLAADARRRFSIEKIAAMWEELFNSLSGTGRVADAMPGPAAHDRYGS